MLNVYRDFNESGFISPYIGGGIGAAQVSFSGTGWDSGARPILAHPEFLGAIISPAAGARYVTTNDDDLTYIVNLIAGIGWRLSDQFIIDTQYRFVRLGETNYGGNSDRCWRFGRDPSGRQLLPGHDCWWRNRHQRC
ncbi:outer membrane protein [Hyphobacterium sp. CCMP332]|uniref:outer membrane protein n=1 Tax=Hyphobacterium sp. CCMP332 TaxID=2749086 RepID=UPI001F429561|nr:hypothetical protein [Hyphobacterium sp. CCMP332]